MAHWDPIGVADTSEAGDEYDAYLEPIAAILEDGGSRAEIAEYLAEVERTLMELGPVTTNDRLETANWILEWHAAAKSQAPRAGHTTVIDRARADIEAGRLWKARDRLSAAFKHDPADLRVADLLGEVYLAMGDQPSAGRYWLLTERDDAQTQATLSAFEQRWGGNLGEKLKMVQIRQGIEYPPTAQGRIQALSEEARRAGIEWPAPEPLRISTSDDPFEEEWGGLRDWLVGGLLAILGPGLWLLGIAAAVYLLVGLLAG